MSDLAGRTLGAGPCRTLGAGPTAQQVIDGESFAVELDLTPVAADLILDLARVMQRAGRFEQFRRLGLIAPGHPSAGELLGHIVGDPAVQTILRLPLHPDAAERLSSELWDAKDEPSTCTWGRGDCASYAHGDLCPAHLERAEWVSQQKAAHG